MMKKSILCILSLVLLAGCRPQDKPALTSFDQFTEPGMVIGIPGDMLEMKMLKEDYPQAEIKAISDMPLAYQDVANGRMDAVVYTRRPMELAIANGTSGVRLLEENYNVDKVAVALSPKSSIAGLQEKINAFIRELKEDGTLDDMYERWVDRGEDTMPQIPAPDHPSFTLKVGTTGTVMPYTYFVGTQLSGYDIELAYRFAAWLGADVEFKVYDFGGIIAAAAAGEIDCVMSNLFMTDQNRDTVPWSDPLMEVEITAMVRDSSETKNAGPEYTSFSQLKGRTVSMLTGAPFEELMLSKEPGIGSFTTYSSTSDMILALKSGKTDAFLSNNAIGSLAVNRNPELALFPENLQEAAFGIAFHKGDPALEQWQDAFAEITEEEKQAVWQKWTGDDESIKVPLVQDWPGTNGTVKAAACDTLEPMSYVGADGKVMGFDIDLILMAAEKLDVHVDFTGMEFSAVLASVQAGKAALGAGSIIITDERKEAVDFAEYYPAAFVLVVRGTKAVSDTSFWASLGASFERTFLREERWKLFADGMLTTLLITVVSALAGTTLGFLVFLWCRSGRRLANGVTKVCLWLVQGMPMVVLLMILNYIIFGKLAINGILVAVMGFTLTFGAGVYGLMKLGVGAVDRGQYEAAYALGYTPNRTFFKIILPQAIPHILPAYRGELVGLIKATAIVGYIAVQDLTKMGDIVRSRTYEAFFPLIAVTVIYFVLEGLLGFLVSRISVSFNPRRRQPSQILKGIKKEQS